MASNGSRAFRALSVHLSPVDLRSTWCGRNRYACSLYRPGMRGVQCSGSVTSQLAVVEGDFCNAPTDEAEKALQVCCDEELGTATGHRGVGLGWTTRGLFVRHQDHSIAPP